MRLPWVARLIAPGGGQTAPVDLSRGGIDRLELSARSGAVPRAELLRAVSEAARRWAPGDALELFLRLHGAGIRDEGFLGLAADYALATRDLAAAHRFAESLYYDLNRSGPALLRLARIAELRGAYGAAVSLLVQYLQQHAGDRRVQGLLGRCYLRLGSFRAALECLRRGGASDPDAERWLSGIVEAGRPLAPRDWSGRVTGFPWGSPREWRERVLRARLQVRATSLREVDLWLNGCRYQSDQRLFGTADYWQTPESTERRRAGDCEDFALWAWVQLLRLGMRARFVVGGLYADEVNHAWVQIHERGRVGVFECTPCDPNVVIAADSATEYRPVLSVDGTLRCYRHGRHVRSRRTRAARSGR